MTTTIPIWFGPEDRPLFGWFHGPAAGRARSGVVICPSFALEYIQAHYAVRLLAERLCSLGMCVVRFDYDGMGDSAGSSRDSKRVESWMASISSAVDVIRNTGVHAISLVGMRIGATLAANVAAHQGGDVRGKCNPSAVQSNSIDSRRDAGHPGLDRLAVSRPNSPNGHFVIVESDNAHPEGTSRSAGSRTA